MGYLIGLVISGIILFLAVMFYRRSNLRVDLQTLSVENKRLEVENEKQGRTLKRLLEKQVEAELNIQKAEKDREVAQQRAAEAQSATEQLLAAEQRRLAAEMKSKKELEEVKLEQELNSKIQALNLYYSKQEADISKQYEAQKSVLDAEILSLKSELDEYQQKYNSIISQLQAEEERKNTIDFHRIQLQQDSKDDIKYLLSIEQNIHNKELLHKLIWTEYLQRPFTQMLNNNFGSKVPKNVIYCIEQISSGKKYIGKTSAEVSKRWTDHLKNSLNIGTIKKQLIHEALFNNWDDFTFNILEIVKDDKLGEREKYYINFFQTDKYGFNIKGGG